MAMARFKCEHCGYQLGARDLVPLLSYAALRGRCRACPGPDQRFSSGHRDGCGRGGDLRLAVRSGSVIRHAVGELPAGLGAAGAGMDRLAPWLPARRANPAAAPGTGLDRVGGTLEAARSRDRHRRGPRGVSPLHMLYQALRKRGRLGRGDVKLFATCGAWLGWQVLLPVVVLAALGEIFLTLVRAVGTGWTMSGATSMPSGACLTLGAFVLRLYAS